MGGWRRSRAVPRQPGSASPEAAGGAAEAPGASGKSGRPSARSCPRVLRPSQSRRLAGGGSSPFQPPTRRAGSLTLPFLSPSRSGCGPGDWLLGSQVIQPGCLARSRGGGGPSLAFGAWSVPGAWLYCRDRDPGGQPQQAAGTGPAQLGPLALSAASAISPVTKETTPYSLIPYTALLHPPRFSAPISTSCPSCQHHRVAGMTYQ